MSQMRTETSTIGVVMQAPETTIEEEPKFKNDKLIAMRIPESLLAKVDAWAIAEGRSRSGQIRHVIDAYADTHYGSIVE